MLAKPSFEPSVATTCVSGSSFTPKRRRVIAGLGPAQAGDALARRSSGRCAACRPSRQSLSITCLGAGRSGLPMPRSTMSAPPAACRCLDAVDLLEDIRRQTLDAVEVRHRSWVLGRSRRRLTASAGLLGLGFFGPGPEQRPRRRRRSGAPRLAAAVPRAMFRSRSASSSASAALTSAAVRGAVGAARLGGPDRHVIERGLRPRARDEIGARRRPWAQARSDSRNSPAGLSLAQADRPMAKRAPQNSSFDPHLAVEKIIMNPTLMTLLWHISCLNR